MTINKPNILIVDDEPKFLELLERIFKSMPINIHKALCGEEALKLVESSVEFSVIISNFHMGRMNGGDFLKEVRIKIPRSIRIMMTAGLGEDKLREFQEDGVIDSFSLKPIIFDNFILQVEKAIEQYRINKNTEK